MLYVKIQSFGDILVNLVPHSAAIWQHLKFASNQAHSFAQITVFWDVIR